MPDYLLRGMPADLWAEMKKDAIDEKNTQRAWIINAIRERLERRKLEKGETKNNEK